MCHGRVRFARPCTIKNDRGTYHYNKCHFKHVLSRSYSQLPVLECKKGDEKWAFYLLVCTPLQLYCTKGLMAKHSDKAAYRRRHCTAPIIKQVREKLMFWSTTLTPGFNQIRKLLIMASICEEFTGHNLTANASFVQRTRAMNELFVLL